MKTRRWDSSDPERAPPPLPLNPGSSSPASKPNTSATIAAAAEALSAKARESAYTINPSPNRSPERSLIKGQYHKRMQTLQNGNNANTRDRTPFLDGATALERFSERLPRSPALDFENRSPERSPTRTGPTTPGAKDLSKNSLCSKPASRPLKAILGENHPPQTTMSSLQETPVTKDIDTSLSDITNNSSALIRTPHTFDAISSQILSLTNIATNLQREMAQLSRRSKDNATDLISLKEATNLRDEDIRKSLRDLVSNLSSKLIEPGAESSSRSTNNHRGPGSFLIDSKPHVSPSGMTKSCSLPRIPSPSSFSASIEREIASSPYNLDGAASIALLEKILREMGTKEGQERLYSALSNFHEWPKIKDSEGAVAGKLDEILTFLKEGINSHALVTRRSNGKAGDENSSKLELEFDSRALQQAGMSKEANTMPGLAIEAKGAYAQSRPAAGFLSDNIINMLKKMKDSIAEGGGMTAELKALVRELRGEVLGMGREIGRKLDQAESSKGDHLRNEAQGPGREEIAEIVEQGLADLKDHMENLMREKRRISSSSVASRSIVDSQEVYAVVKTALSEIPLLNQIAMQDRGSGVEREEILDAVREAWEMYKPTIEVQSIGLERNELLRCLKEGLHQYQPQDQTKELGGASYEDVLDAVREGLKHFDPPPPVEFQPTITKEEILMTMRECLDTFEFPSSSLGPLRESEITRDDVLDAVKEGLSTQSSVSKEIEFNRDDLFEAIKVGLDGVHTSTGGIGEQVLDKMQDLLDGMRVEFKQYSVANGGDTEQVLDAMKDGLEVLRADIETYVDRAADVTGKDEIIETVRDGLEHLRNDLEGSISNVFRDPGQFNSGEILDGMEKEFEHLRQTIATSMLRTGETATDSGEILDTIREGLEELKSNLLSRSNHDDTLQAVHTMREEFEHLRETLSKTLIRSGSSADKEQILEAIQEGLENVRADVSRGQDRPESILSNTGELLDAFNDGLEGLRSDIERMVNKPLDMTVNYEILDTLKEGLLNIRSDVDRLRSAESDLIDEKGREVVIADGEVENLRRNDIENLEIMITQLRIKVEALDNMPPSPQPEPRTATPDYENAAINTGLQNIEATLRNIQSTVTDFAQREQFHHEGVVTKDDTEAIETLLRNTRAKIDEMLSPSSEGLARVAQLETVETLMRETRDAVNDFGADKASKEDVGILEVLLQEVRAGLEEMREKTMADDATDGVNKSDLETLETICMETKTYVEGFTFPDIDQLPVKSDIEFLIDLVKTSADSQEQAAHDTKHALASRKQEHLGICDKVEDVKLFLDDVKAELKAKLSEDGQSIQELGKTLETFTGTISNNDLAPAVNELKETVVREIETVSGILVGSDLEREQKHDILLLKHDEQKGAIVAELSSKLDERFDEIMTKYDDAQLAAGEKEKAFQDRDMQHTEALNTTKTVAEDLRLLVDTLGSTITESSDRMTEDSKTVFERIDNVATKIDGILALDPSSEHQLTRAQISNTLSAVEGVQVHVAEYQPRILESIKEVLNVVGQHYEQAKVSTEEIKTSVNAIPSALPLPAIAAPPSLPPPPQESPLHEKYDDSGVHAKLDQLVENAESTSKSLAQLTLLDQIREEVTTTAYEFNAFVAKQQATITQAANDRAKEAEEAAVALQRRISEKQCVEADIIRMTDQKHDLSREVQDLLREKEEMSLQRSKMQADLSSLQTALQLRREELHIMEARADGLERRILDGVLDHSRSLLTTSRPQSSLKEMNLKRVVSTASSTTTTARATTVEPMNPSHTASAVSSGIGLALKRRQPATSIGISTLAGKGDRRILSLSTIGVNKGANAERSMVLADPSLRVRSREGGAFNTGMVKRSHSVKSNFPVRKTSWGGTKTIGMYADDGLDDIEDKENSILDEEDEDFDDDEGSQAGTERRTSYSGTYTGTMSYGDGSTLSEGDRRTSYAHSNVGSVGTKSFAMTDEDASDSDSQNTDAEYGMANSNGLAAKGEISNASEMVVFGLPSDSGIGTEIPTAALEGRGDYFPKG